MNAIINLLSAILNLLINPPALLTVLFTVLLTVFLTHFVRSWYENKKAIMSIKGELEENLHRAKSLTGDEGILQEMKSGVIHTSDSPVISFLNIWGKHSNKDSREYMSSSPRFSTEAWSLNKRVIFEKVGEEARREVTTT